MSNNIGGFLQHNIIEGKKLQFCGTAKEVAFGKERMVRGVADMALDLTEKGMERAGRADLKAKATQLRERNHEAKKEALYGESCGTMDRISGKWQAKLATKAEVGRQALESGMATKLAQAAGACASGALCIAGAVLAVKEPTKAVNQEIEEQPIDRDPPGLARMGPRSVIANSGEINDEDIFSSDDEGDGEDISSSDSDDERLILDEQPENAEVGGPRSAIANLDKLDLNHLSSDDEGDGEDEIGQIDLASGAFLQNVFKGREEKDRYQLTETLLEKLNDAASDYFTLAKNHYSNVPKAASKKEAVQYATALSKVLSFELGLH